MLAPGLLLGEVSAWAVAPVGAEDVGTGAWGTWPAPQLQPWSGSGPERGPAMWSLTGPPPSVGTLLLPQRWAGAAMPLPPAQLRPDWQPVVKVSHWQPLVASRVASDHGALGCLCLMASDFV